MCGVVVVVVVGGYTNSSFFFRSVHLCSASSCSLDQWAQVWVRFSIQARRHQTWSPHCGNKAPGSCTRSLHLAVAHQEIVPACNSCNFSYISACLLVQQIRYSLLMGELCTYQSTLFTLNRVGFAVFRHETDTEWYVTLRKEANNCFPKMSNHRTILLGLV